VWGGQGDSDFDPEQMEIIEGLDLSKCKEHKSYGDSQ